MKHPQHVRNNRLKDTVGDKDEFIEMSQTLRIITKSPQKVCVHKNTSNKHVLL